MENWVPVASRPTYEVSDQGRVRNTKTGKLLAGSIRKDGYRQFILGRGYTRTAHVLVLENFVGPRPPGMLACHRDDDPANNRLSNLYWGSPRQNCEDRIVLRRQKGIDASAAKLTREQVRSICKRLDAGHPMKEIAADFGIAVATVGRINTGQNWAWLTKRGAQHGRKDEHRNRARKLDGAKANEIVRMSREGMSQAEIGRVFGVAKQTVEQVLSGRIWAHATGIGKV